MIRIRVDAGSALQPVDRRKLGLNINYLMDGDVPPPGARSVTEALRELGVGALRYPGGEKSDTFLWSVPPYDRPVPTPAGDLRDRYGKSGDKMVHPDGYTYRKRPLDFDAFIKMCRDTGAEPVVVVAYDCLHMEPTPRSKWPSRERLLESAVAWIKYANITKKYRVRYWEIGNEGYIDKTVKARDYAADVVLFSRAMKAVDPEIRIGANGPTGADDTGNAAQAAGDTTSWWKTVIETAGPDIDFLAVHSYPCWKWKTYAHYAENDPPLCPECAGALEALRRWATPADRNRIRLLITEANAADWSSTQGTKDGWPMVGDLGHAVVLFDMLGSALLNPALDAFMVWNTRWINNGERPELWDTIDPNNEITAIGRPIAIWGKHALDLMVTAEGSGPVRAYATKSADGKKLTVFLINRGMVPAEAGVEIAGFTSAGPATRWVFHGSGPDDLKPAWERSGEVALEGGPARSDLPGVSVTVLVFGS